VHKKIKILHLIKSLGRGGAEKLIPESAMVHDQTKFEFHCLYFYHQKNNMVDELESAGIQVHSIRSGNLGLFLQVNRVREFVIANDFDIIHAHLPWAGILARSVGKKLEIPIVYTEHNTWERYNKLSYWGNRVSFKQQDVAIAVSNEVALSMRLNSIWDPYQRGGRMKLKVIQNGVNTSVFRRLALEKTSFSTDDSDTHQVNGLNEGSLIKKTLNIPDNAMVIGIVAVFRTQKRLWLWVEVALKILEDFPQTHFLLVGDGEWRSKIMSQINTSEKSSNFHLVGTQKDVLPYLSVMDIYLSTSEFEGLPIAMLEAMSCKVPVVATRAGGIGELIQHGVQGFLSEVDDWEDLVSHCSMLLEDAELQQQMAHAARVRVKQEFSMNRMVQELEEVYREVVRK